MISFRVLIIDDEQEFVETLVKRLRRRNFFCEGVFSGTQGLAWLDEQECDVVLLDMRLPDMDGNEVLRRIKQKKPEVQVVILTGHASASAGLEGILAGAHDYLMKPVEFETLVEKLVAAHEERVATIVPAAADTQGNAIP
jgi:DNA-binding response OmpR family regulator